MQLFHFHHSKRHLKKRTIALDPLPSSVRCVRSWKWWQLWTTPNTPGHLSIFLSRNIIYFQGSKYNFQEVICIKLYYRISVVYGNMGQCSSSTNSHISFHNMNNILLFSCQETWIAMSSCRSAVGPFPLTIFIFPETFNDAVYITLN